MQQPQPKSPPWNEPLTVCADIWRYLDSASPSEATDLEVSLGFYRSLLFPGGGITGITPSNLTPENIIRAAYTDMARSFLRVLPEFGDTPAERIAVSGKFAPVLIAVLKRISPEKREYIRFRSARRFSGD